MTFGLYLAGYLILIIGLAVAANMLHVPPRWIGVGVIVMVGFGILTGAANARQKDHSN